MISGCTCHVSFYFLCDSHFADLEARYMPDTQKEVYNAFFCELDTAVAVLSDYIVEHPVDGEFTKS